MGAQANIVISDGQATPVSHTFYANGVRPAAGGGTIAVYKDRVTGIPVGYATITLTQRESAMKFDVIKRVMVPTLETISGSDGGYTPRPKVAYTCMSTEQFVLPGRSTTQERKNLRAFSLNLLSNSAMVSAVDDLEPVW